jgi:predicted dehydrogenase/threonine dehydrogenase-like Zn-dependent dehydrogenase
LKQVLIRQGKAVVESTPAPLVELGTVLVSVDHSCISIGTELSSLRSSGTPLWQRAMNQPERIKQVVRMVVEDGVNATRSRVQRALKSDSAVGYSLSGEVIEVGSGIQDLKPGDKVACAGAQCAHHAEVVRIPRNLAVRIPEPVGFAAASTVALGAIALQGVRRAQPTLGEWFVVIGLGIVGQLTVQLLKANGCHVLGLDLNPERIALAKLLGLDIGLSPDGEAPVEQVNQVTDGWGADGVIITAATASDAVVSQAFHMCRKKGRVVLVGDVGLHLRRDDFYAKEIDFLISTSYGPGRYDASYEEHGLEYPIGYVRWTENRNMAEYLRLIANGRIEIDKLITRVFPLENASEAYEFVKAPESNPLFVLLRCQQRPEAAAERVIANPVVGTGKAGLIRTALVGAGGYAKGMHLPHLQSLSDRYAIHAVCSRTGHNAAAAARQFDAKYATTDFEAILADKDVDAVIIATRHHLHTNMALAALAAGKHVLLEKPLAIRRDDLVRVADFFADNPRAPMLLTGFNRRFSPHLRAAEAAVRERTNPMIINYRMNAGHIPMDHWVHGPEGGGRNIGEACHIYDVFSYLTNARVVKVQVQAIRPATAFYGLNDNFQTTISFDDGSLAHLTYSAAGSRDYPKERMEIFVDGKIIEMIDYQSLSVFGGSTKGGSLKRADKGQREELIAFADAIRKAQPWPSPLWQQVQATEIAFDVEQGLTN